MRSEDQERAARLAAGRIVGPDELVAPLCAYAKERPEVQSIWLFGSQAEGRARKTSDLDLALQVRPAPAEEDEIGYRADRAREIGDLISLPVDVVLLSDALPLPLLWSIVRSPKVLYEKLPGEAAATGSFLRGICRDQWPRVERRWERTRQWLRGLAEDATA